MKQELSGTAPSSRDLGLKFLIICGLILALFLPLVLIGQVASERRVLSDTVRAEIINLNGGRSAVIGPIMGVPVNVRTRDAKGDQIWLRREVLILADSIEIDAFFITEIRKRGIYEVPLFSGPVVINAEFSGIRDKVAQELIGEEWTADWQNAWYAVDLRDKRSLRSTPTISINGGEPTALRGSTAVLSWTVSSIRAPTIAVNETSRVHISMDISGGGAFTMHPLAGSVRARVVSDWPSPSFSGYIMPASRTIESNGFSAEWYLPESARVYPESTRVEGTRPRLADGDFGVELFQPVTVYHKTERALKYGLLFVIIPFIVFFMFELFLGRRIHPLQYLLIGLADVFFYLLLLSFSEHIPFMAAYALGALAVCSLVTFYSAAVLGAWKRAVVMLPVLGAIYGYLYIALESEDYALLVGAIGVFAILSAVMIITRKVDWYRIGAGPAKAETHTPQPHDQENC